MKVGRILFFLFISSCTSYEQFRYMTEEFEIPFQVYDTVYVEAWQGVLDVMQKYDLETTNQEAGVIKTRWIDNTNEINFTDYFGSRGNIKSARFKVVVNVVKGFRGTREVTKITVFKRQMIEYDFLQGWKIFPTDGILEKTILYRIERTLAIAEELKRIEDAKAKEAEESF